MTFYDSSLKLFRLPHRPQLRYAFGLCLVLATIWGLSRIEVNDDLRLLQNSPKDLVSDQLKLAKLLDSPTPVQYFLVPGLDRRGGASA